MQNSRAQPQIDNLEGWVRRLSRMGVIIGGILLLAVSVLVVVEVILRKFFATSIQGVDTLSSFGMAVSFTWAMPYAILHRVHVRIDVLHMILPFKLRAWLDLGSAVIFFIYVAVLSWFCVQLAMSSYRNATVSSGILAVPLSIPQGLWSAGFVASVFALIYLVVKSGRALRRGDYVTVSRLIGTENMPREEIEEARHFDQGRM